MQGIPLPVVARLLGHAQVQMTLRYAHVSDRDVEAAAERIGGAPSRPKNKLYHFYCERFSFAIEMIKSLGRWMRPYCRIRVWSLVTL